MNWGGLMQGRDERGRFTKGNGGGGRRATPESFKEALISVSREALEVVIGIMRNTEISPSLRLKAAESILDRTFGRPVQSQLVIEADKLPPDDGLLAALSQSVKVVFSGPQDEPKGIDDI